MQEKSVEIVLDMREKMNDPVRNEYLIQEAILNSKGFKLLEQLEAGLKNLPEIDTRPSFTEQVMLRIKEKEKSDLNIFPSPFITPKLNKIDFVHLLTKFTRQQSAE